MGIIHNFVSAKADSPDATLINPSNWNADHDIETPAALVGDVGIPIFTDAAGISALGGIVGNGAFNYLRQKGNVSAKSYEFKAPLIKQTSDYNFPVQTPGGSLAVGSNTITLTPVPLGVNGVDVLHKLYITGGAGTAEAVLVTGGTAVSGAASGTVIVTCAYTHSGAWTIGSATGGLQEIVNVVASSSDIIQLDAAYTELHAAVTFPASGNVKIRGSGMVRSAILRSADYPAGNLLQTNGGTVWIDLSEFEIWNSTGLGTSGASIYYNANGAGGYSNLTNLYIVSGGIGIKIDSGSNVIMRGLQVQNFDATSNPFATLWITATGAVEPFGIFISDSSFGSIGAGVGVLIDAVDGFLVSNVAFGGDFGMHFRGITGGTYIANCHFTQVFIDGPITSALKFTSNGAGGPFMGGMKFTGCHFHGQNLVTGTTGMNIGIDIGASAGVTTADYLEFHGCHISGFRLSGVSLIRPGAVHIAFHNNWLVDNNISDTAVQSGMILATGSTNLIIHGNHFVNTVAGGKMNYAINQFGTLSESSIQGNTCTGMTVGPLSILGATTTTIRRNNVGVDNVVGSIALAATLVLPVNPNFVVTGTGTTVTAVTMLQVAPGSGGTFRTTGGNITFTATGGIGSAGTTVQNKLYQWFYDGTSLWIYGSGF